MGASWGSRAQTSALSDMIAKTFQPTRISLGMNPDGSDRSLLPRSAIPWECGCFIHEMSPSWPKHCLLRDPSHPNLISARQETPESGTALHC